MTDHHPDFEGLSAHVDGEAPEWADHVAACATCRASADQLRAVAAAVGTPVEPFPAASRETAIAAALDDVTRRRPERRRPERRPWAVLSAAAVIVGVLGFSALLAFGSRSTDRTTVAGPALESAPAGGTLSGAQADSSAAASLPPTDLGDVPDAATLLALARPAIARPTDGAEGSASAPPVATTAPLTQRSAAPTVAGTRPCEEQSRAREPGLGEVVYFATARRGQTPAVVLGFTSAPAPAPVTLLLLAQDGCQEVLRAAGP